MLSLGGGMPAFSKDNYYYNYILPEHLIQYILSAKAFFLTLILIFLFLSFILPKCWSVRKSAIIHFPLYPCLVFLIMPSSF